MSKSSTTIDVSQIMRRCLVVIFLGMVSVLSVVLFLSKDLPSLEQLENYDPDLVTRIYSADGKVLTELFVQKRVFVELTNIPIHMQNAVIASEDRRFYQHWGLSLRSVARAIFINTLSMSYRQGFSTLTQQLARNLYKSVGFEDSIIRKLKEVITAIQIERTYTKDEILEMYLNTVHFGHGTYGVEAATKRFFGKESMDLTVDESAMLVGLLPSPASYSPIHHPKKAIRRRNTVLRLLRDQKFIQVSEFHEYRSKTLESVQEWTSRGTAPYFTEYVRRLLEKIDEELGINIYRDGLKIYTTVDSRLQKIAERTVLETIQEDQARLNRRLFNNREEFENLAYLTIYPEDTLKAMMAGEGELYKDLRDKLLVQCAFVALDSKTGAILAMVGGRPDYHDQFNRAVQAKRQPGSVFKPFVYTTALDNGYPVTEQLLNQPVVLNVQNMDGTWVKWKPQNYDGSTGGLTTLREGLRKSMNLISVRMVQQDIASSEQVKKTAQRMGISTDIRAVDALALGTSEVYPIEMVAAYAAYSNKGVYSKPFAITRIEDRYGNILKEYFPEQKEVLSEETAYLMTSLLQTVMDRGTGGSVRWKYKFNRPAAGKTGTTQGWSDAWFVGFTPQISAGGWFGVDDFRVPLGPGQDGTKAALPAWAKFMKAAHDTLNYPVQKFEIPAGIQFIEICSVSKKSPLPACPVEKEIFKKGTEPTQKCKVHRT
ncbi:MAG: PBP1A family penicillin-binding protein [Candidatus Marinimicrobia bacterium]|jgi:penicillin-binding protein 1A|nr:PBP1A family penicillin-binding protein [Candidatus Neomarinimicrobiota bacterium]MBT5115613.1 PBP1A family penicillin-binding protein [Candidatus Neomarinimicrobiota bacterium]MBT7042997.1 PBP1A family penicillin-binding protein [Candidatus Neomarinimicrobiota bacterium]MBT7515987.1 PBP1A family penicillin-binding protein [Candidatus Neomarinimicrobiota bacterium]MBT7944654.1 PBP1A family penicillin-binding protein [Candidatus Neomarinimicrobiota bacterium]|tara:strand:+ start:15439 stop:17571 length:2133 start_codon:yes stop_codon:yes gene_type:complete